MRTRLLVREIGREADEVVPRNVPMRVSRLGVVFSPQRLGRDALSIATPSEGGAGVSPAPSIMPVGEYWSDINDPTVVQSTLPEVEDDRLFHPDDARPLRRVSGRAVRRLSVSGSKLATYVPDAIEVPAEASVIMCIRRKSRRGVILALGQGGGFHRKPRRSPKSDIWC